MKKDGKFIDPALGMNRFDFNGEPLTEEDVEEFRDEDAEISGED